MAIKVMWRERSLRALYMYLIGIEFASRLCFTHSILDLTEGEGQAEITSLSMIPVSMALGSECVNLKLQTTLVTGENPFTSSFTSSCPSNI